MTPDSYNALAALAKKNETKMLRIRPVAALEGEGDAAAVHIILPLKDLAQARPGESAGRRGLGFVLGPVDIVLPDGTPIVLHASWVSLTLR